MDIPPQALHVRVAFLPPMSGLAATEDRLDAGSITRRIGEGLTAEVLRNLCYKIAEDEAGGNLWDSLRDQIRSLFLVDLEKPEYIPERGEITMSYRESSGVKLDLSCGGRGLQQTLLLLAHLYQNTGSVLLLDEPDAHLEILRQQEIYQLLSDAARKQNSQIIAASHSEILLNEAANRDVVVAFVGKPHRIDDRGSQVRKALQDIKCEDYYRAEQTGFVLYLEGSTDLAILRAFAERVNHPAQDVLRRLFVHYVENKPNEAEKHFHGLREAKLDLVGLGVFDRLDRADTSHPGLTIRFWKRREIENYLCYEETLIAYAASLATERSAGPLYEAPDRKEYVTVMEQVIRKTKEALEMLNKGSPWSPETKVSDEFLSPVFERFFEELGIMNLMRKTNYHRLAQFVPHELIDPEVGQVLDLIVKVQNEARPLQEEGRD